MLEALRFAALKRRNQRRKGEEGSSYLHHCIDVADALAALGGVEDPHVLAAAVLHDTMEDTDTTPDELEERFGGRVRMIVEEVSDDRALTRERRRAVQVEKASTLSWEAKLIKLADKICNVGDVAHAPPIGWSLERRAEYVEWTAQVVDGCRGTNPDLERRYDDLLAEARRALSSP
ncbi:MAG: bifunctional (p)ppGpp synthetase/guanosine-3',5'-bis(diphosphate) 3'-pyrophosphohydrolase [Gemmatimonadetes bacterium]|nr:bifunctional (p)ppGpp synthetase/guanosine-3',5'-bis(diphosphate) 3'-pyrophosphohydrolase [Gemmatimonadota bacterium]